MRSARRKGNRKSKKHNTLFKINVFLILVIILLLLLTLKGFNIFGNLNSIILLDDNNKTMQTSTVPQTKLAKHPIFVSIDKYKKTNESTLLMSTLSKATIDAIRNMQYKKEQSLETQIITEPSVIVADTNIQEEKSWEIPLGSMSWNLDSAIILKYLAGGSILMYSLSYFAPYTILNPIY